MGYLDATGLSHLWTKIKSALSGKATLEVTTPSNLTSLYVNCKGLVVNGKPCFLPALISTDTGNYRFNCIAMVQVSNGVLTNFTIQGETEFTTVYNQHNYDSLRLRSQEFIDYDNFASSLSSDTTITQIAGDIYHIDISSGEVRNLNYKRKHYKIS